MCLKFQELATRVAGGCRRECALLSSTAVRFVVAAVLASACGRAPPPAAPQVDDVDDVDGLEPAAIEPAPAEPEVAPPAYRPASRPRRSPERIYRGRRIDLDVRNADLVNLFRFLATVGGVNIVVAPEVRGQVTLRLRRVPWDQVAHVVARANGLVIERDGGIWLIRKKR